MRSFVILLLSVTLPTVATAQQARYLSTQNIANIYTGHTMMWEDYKTPEKPAAIVHYTTDGKILIMYDGQYVPNDLTFSADGMSICWRRETVCRSFVRLNSGRIFVVNPNAPSDLLAEVTHVADDQDAEIF